MVCPNGYIMSRNGICMKKPAGRRGPKRSSNFSSVAMNNLGIKHSGNNTIQSEPPGGGSAWDNCDELEDVCYDAEQSMAGTWFGQTSNTVPAFCNCYTTQDYVWNANNVPDLVGLGGCMWVGWMTATWGGETDFFEGLGAFFDCMGEDFNMFMNSNPTIEYTEVYTNCMFQYQSCLQHYNKNFGGSQTPGVAPGEYRQGGRIKRRRR